MASRFSISTVLLLTAVINIVAVTAVPEREYYSMLAALRVRGYHLFANAITTTDLHYDILNGIYFTLFAPIDSALYAIDMSLSASDYTMALRSHCVTQRLSLRDLRLLPYGSNSLPTLVPDYEIHILNPLLLPLPIMVEGVSVTFPGLFYDEHIAVHGLEGIIDFRSLTDTGKSTPNITSNVTSNSTSNQAFNSTARNLTNDNTPPPSPLHREASSPSPHTVEGRLADTSPPPAPYTEIHMAASPVPVPQYSTVVISEEVLGLSIPMAPWNRQNEGSSESTGIHGREEHMSTATRYELISDKIPGVSLATNSTAEEFTEVDDKIINIDCPFSDDDGQQLNIDNTRHGNPNTRELYTPTNMTCPRT